ncbi:hypothetical protein Bca4012_013394 [Brassica carinata]
MVLWCGRAVVGFWLVLGEVSTSLSRRVLFVCGVKLIIDPMGLSLVGWGRLAVSLD